jgi:DNA polymerase-1
MAHYSQDKALLEAFRTGKDVYESIGSMVGCDRALSKTLWLAIAYNASAYTIAEKSGLSYSDASVFLTRLKLAYPTLFYWIEKTKAEAQIKGGIYTMFGAFRKLGMRETKDKKTKKFKVVDASYLGPNYFIQGSAAEIMKLAMQATRHLPGVLTVHDELVFEIPEKDVDVTMREISAIMSKVVELTVPLEVEAGSGVNWGVAKP